MRNLLIAGAFILCGAGSACAQTAPKTEFFAGYEYLHLNPGGRGCHGFDLNLAYNVKDWVGGVGDRYNDRFSVRVVQAEYLWTHFGGTGWNNARITAGLVYTW